MVGQSKTSSSGRAGKRPDEIGAWMEKLYIIRDESERDAGLPKEFGKESLRGNGTYPRGNLSCGAGGRAQLSVFGGFCLTMKQRRRTGLVRDRKQRLEVWLLDF